MKTSRYAISGILIVGLLAAAVFFVKKNNPVAPLLVSQTDQKAMGPMTAPVQIVEYSDFQCPACQKAEPIIQAILTNSEYAGKIRFIFRHYPLPNHRWAGLAHQAAECAHQQGRFWEYHDRLYAEQAKWSALDNPTETFLLYANELNLPLEAFGLCLANPEVRAKVLEDRNKGDQMQVNSTPTFFVNGERVVGPIELQIKGNEIIRKVLGLPAAPAPTPSPSPS